MKGNDTITPDTNVRGRSVAARMLRLVRYLKPYWRRQLAALLFLIGGTAASLLIPLLVKELLLNNRGPR